MAEQLKIIYSLKSTLEGKGLKEHLMKTKVMVSKIWQVTVRPSSKNDQCSKIWQVTVRPSSKKDLCGKIWQVTVRPSSKKDQCGICGRKTMVNAVLCKSCGNWIHGRCAKINMVTNRLATDIKCRNCKGYDKNVDQWENLHDDAETVTEFTHRGNRINSGDGCEVV